MPTNSTPSLHPWFEGVGRQNGGKTKDSLSFRVRVRVRVIVERKWSGQKKAWEGGEKSKREDLYD